MHNDRILFKDTFHLNSGFEMFLDYLFTRFNFSYSIQAAKIN